MQHPPRWILLSVVLVPFIASAPSPAAVGDIDPTYGQGGLFDPNLLGNARGYSLTTGLLGDGSVLYARHPAGAGARFGHRDVNGQPDPSFGPGGEATPIPGFDTYAPITVRDANGRVVMPGLVGGSFALARFNLDGSLDRSFGGTGVVTRAGPYSGGVALQPDGRIVAALTYYSSYLTTGASILRLNVDGSTDAAFGNKGESPTVSFGNGCCGDYAVVAALGGRGLAIYSDVAHYMDGVGEVTTAPASSPLTGLFRVKEWAFAGKIDDHRELYGGAAGGSIYLAALFDDGSADRAFGDTGLGVARLDMSSLGGLPAAASINAPDVVTVDRAANHIHVAVSVAPWTYILRLRASGIGAGQVDAGFGRGGVVRLPYLYAVADMVEQANGALVLTTIEGKSMRLVGSAAAGGASAVGISPLSQTVEESAGSVTITVSRVGGSVGTASVAFSTNVPVGAGQGATAGSDFTPVSGRLTWADGDSRDQQITVPILNDTNSESIELFEVVLSDPSGVVLTGVTRASISIRDDDVAAAAPATTPGSVGATGGGASSGGGALDGWTLLVLASLWSAIHGGVRRLKAVSRGREPG